VPRANEDTTSREGKLQGIECNKRLGRKLQVKAVRGSKGAQRKEQNKEHASKR